MQLGFFFPKAKAESSPVDILLTAEWPKGMEDFEQPLRYPQQYMVKTSRSHVDGGYGWEGVRKCEFSENEPQRRRF